MSQDYDAQSYDESDLELFRDTIKKFIADEILPDYEAWEKAGIIPREVWNKMGEAALLCVDVPEEYGGYGVPARFSFAIVEEFSRANCSAIATGLAVHSDIVAHYIVDSGTDEQKKKYLPKMVSGECVGAIAMTEPAAGSDLQGIRTTAKEDGNGYVINGSKTFITNGQHCNVVITVTKTDTTVAGSKGTSLFLVDTDTDGFAYGRNLDKMGIHCADTSELFFEDVRVPGSALLGGFNQGFGTMMNELPRERLSLAVGAVGAAEGMIRDTIEYVKERKAFGQEIAKFQNTRFRIAEMETDIRIHRAFLNECMASFAAGKLDNASVSMAKFSCTEMQGRVADGCLQLFGGYGYMTEYGISRAYVDARVQRIYGGTTEIMKELISRSLLGR